jgi:purine catabolism regulator
VLHAGPILSANLDAAYNGATVEARHAAGRFDLLSMLTVQDIVSLPSLGLRTAAGAAGLENDVRWLHASELADPTPWLEGGELLLTTGLGIGSEADGQRAYVRRLAGHRLAGLGFGLGFGYETVPAPLVEEADRQSFPIFEVPYEVPFIAISKAVFSHLASEQLELVTQALEVHERLAQAVTHGRGAESLLAVVASHLGCSLALVDENARVLVERHAGRRLDFTQALELPVVADDEMAVLRVARAGGEFGEYDRLVLHHAQTALAFELSRRHAVSAAELRLAGDLLDDLEHERLDDREAARRMAAFGLEPGRPHAALVAIPRDGRAGAQVRAGAARELDRRAIRYLSTARRDRAAFLVEVADEEAALTLAGQLIEIDSGARVGVGRPAQGRALGRSLLEARAALGAATANVVSYRDLGSLELLLSLPDAALEAFVDRVLGPAASNTWLTESLAALLESGCRWSEAADRLGVHRHTLRYRMERLREQTGRHPDDPEQRMELWLAVRASQALASRREPEPVG